MLNKLCKNPKLKIKHPPSRIIGGKKVYMGNLYLRWLVNEPNYWCIKSKHSVSRMCKIMEIRTLIGQVIFMQKMPRKFVDIEHH